VDANWSRAQVADPASKKGVTGLYQQELMDDFFRQGASRISLFLLLLFLLKKRKERKWTNWPRLKQCSRAAKAK
jgi:hypothetical protein